MWTDCPKEMSCIHVWIFDQFVALSVLRWTIWSCYTAHFGSVLNHRHLSFLCSATAKAWRFKGVQRQELKASKSIENFQNQSHRHRHSHSPKYPKNHSWNWSLCLSLCCDLLSIPLLLPQMKNRTKTHPNGWGVCSTPTGLVFTPGGGSVLYCFLCLEENCENGISEKSARILIHTHSFIDVQCTAVITLHLRSISLSILAYHVAIIFSASVCGTRLRTL